MTIFIQKKIKNQTMEKLTLENISSYIKEESQHIHELAKRLGQDHAQSNLPNPSQANFATYIHSIRSAFTNLWVHIETHFLDAQAIVKMGELQISQADSEIKRNEDEYRSTKAQLDEVNDRLFKVDNIYNWKMFWFIILVFCVLVGVEAVFNSSFLQMLSGVTFEEARIIAVFIYVLVFLAVLWFNSKILSTENRSLRAMYRFLFFVIIGGFLAYTSYARTMFSNEQFDLITFIGVFVINSLVFIGMLHLHKYLPTKEQIDTMMYHRQFKKKKQVLEKKLEQLKAELKGQSTQSANMVKDTQQTLLMLEKNKKYLLSQYDIAVSTYIATNLQLRSDRLSPNSFSEIPPLNLN